MGKAQRQPIIERKPPAIIFFKTIFLPFQSNLICFILTSRVYDVKEIFLVELLDLADEMIGPAMPGTPLEASPLILRHAI